MDLIDILKNKVQEKCPTIVFPEGEDPRILGAVKRLQDDKVIKPIVLGATEAVEKTAKDLNIDLSELNFIDPETSEALNELKAALLERRKGKLDEAGADKLIRDVNYFGTMLVYTGKAEGLVSGAVHTTGETVKPALQIIKTKEGFKRTAGAFIMLRGDEMYLMADCAINIEHTPESLAETAVLAGETAKTFDMDPKIAMLSFSTKGSASHETVDRVVEATKLAKAMAPELKLDGELQFDAAFVPEVAKKKAPDSDVAGQANVFIFPSLEAGNIGYKLAQRFGGFEAVGPILMGLNAPVNDLSRGCVEDEVYSLAIITAAQSLM
ncbi:phosphate acetyltransferase [Peptoniphilus equinus]|nr:phosphate acetyltransferase [Peptoniphilus equinus]